MEHHTGREWYLPHNPVMNQNKPGKVRRVRNGMLPTVSRSFFEQSPANLSRSSEEVDSHADQIRSATKPTGRCVAIRSTSSPFLWREDPQRPLTCISTLDTSSAQKTQQLAQITCCSELNGIMRKKYPDAAEAVHENFYMDDYLDSTKSSDEALKWSRDVVILLSKGGLKLTKFFSNVPGLLEELKDQSVVAFQKVIGASMEQSLSHSFG